MNSGREEWVIAKNELVSAIKGLGFPEDLGNEVAKNLGSPKAMNRMCSYLYNVKPQKAELIVDEMLAIRSDIQRWKEKKEVEAANAWYNEFLYYGLDNEE